MFKRIFIASFFAWALLAENVFALDLPTGISAGPSSMGDRSSAASWSVGGTAAPQNMNAVERVVLEEINTARDVGFTDAEVQKVRTAIRANYDKDYANDAAVAGMWMDRLERDMTFADYEVFVAKVQAVTPALAQATLKKYIDPSTLSIVKAGDKSKMK